MAPSSHRSLYQLPKKQLDRIERRQHYDKMKTVLGGPGGASSTAAASTGSATGNAAVVASSTTTTTTMTTTNGAATTHHSPPKQQQQHHYRPQPPLILMHGAPEVAALPLLRPFQIKKPSESTIVNTIINEQHAADTLAAILKQEEKLRSDLSDLQKPKNENKDSNNGGKKNNDSSGGWGAAIGRSSAIAKGGAGKQPSSNNKKTSRKQNIAANSNSEQIKVIESQMSTIAQTIHQCRSNLGQFAGWTKAMLQAEYSKLAVTLDPDSLRYSDLEEAFEFLCPRLDAAHGAEDYCHDQRIAYVREMIPVMKKAGVERNFPTSLVTLPYIQKFQADDPESPVVASLIEEMHQLKVTEGVRARLEKQIHDQAKFRVLKHAEEMLDRREVETSELVRKHYRKRSIKLHPDRNGENYRPIFEEFTDARTVLSDVKLRQSYLGGMLDVFKFYGTNMMTESHEAWNKKHRPDKAESDTRGGGDGTDGFRGRPLKLEGGLHQQIPKGVMLHHRRDGRKNHVVSISIHVLRPIHEFYARVRSVRVELRDATDEKYVIDLSRGEIVKNIKFDRQGPILANEIQIGEMALNPGQWEVFWFATLCTVGTDPLNPQNATKDESVTTRPSAKATFHVVDYDQLRKSQDFEMAENICKVIKGELSNTLHKLRTNQMDSASKSTARFGHYHQVLVRARKKCHNLQRLMTLTGKSSSVYDGLSALLTESRQVYAELEEKADMTQKRKEKKDDVKRFKAYIASILESDDPSLWMKDLHPAKLSREGGDVNRLYQLFIEGKGKYALMFDSEMYKEASLRDDIFSTKQCADLAARGEEVIIQEAKEEEDAAAAEAQRKLEEEERAKLLKEAELREKWAMVGQHATIHSLTSNKGKTLNHQIARIVYYSVEKDRLEVQLPNLEKAFLKKEHLTIYYGHVPEPNQQEQQQSKIAEEIKHQPTLAAAPEPDPTSEWDCEKCTFKNDDASTACSICTNPRSKESPQSKKEPQAKECPTESTAALSTETEADKSALSITDTSDDAKLTKTIYVRSSHSKKLTGKRGRKKKDLINKSGTEDIQIATAAIGNYVPAHLTGSTQAVQEAIALIQEAIGSENVSINAPPPLPPSTQRQSPTPTSKIVSPPVVRAPVPPAPIGPTPIEPSPAHIDMNPAISTNTNFVNGIFSGFQKPIHHVSLSGSETQQTSKYSFGDALLPRGLMDMSLPSPTDPIPREVPSEIGINSLVTRETITEASVSSINDRSNDASKTYSNFTLNENDPLLMFLRAQQQCIKGSVDEFYLWLVKSEDIESMMALKEAVFDEEYFNESMKLGNGSSGLKGFKRKAFQRAVLEYEEGSKIMETFFPPVGTPSNDSSTMNAFLPSNLFTGFDDPTPSSVPTNNFGDPPKELICPIGLVLMTNDPVLASDGVTYEHASILDWFQKNTVKIENAHENLRWSPQSEPDLRVVRNGITSPVHGTRMENLILTPNTGIRNMARAYKERKESARL